MDFKELSLSICMSFISLIDLIKKFLSNNVANPRKQVYFIMNSISEICFRNRADSIREIFNLVIFYYYWN